MLQYANDMNKTSEQIEQDIFAFLDAKHVAFESVVRPRGSQRKYPAGTCAMLQGNNNASFYSLLCLNLMSIILHMLQKKV